VKILLISVRVLLGKAAVWGWLHGGIAAASLAQVTCLDFVVGRRLSEQVVLKRDDCVLCADAHCKTRLTLELLEPPFGGIPAHICARYGL